MPATAAAAFVTVPATDDAAVPAVEATLFVTVPTLPTVLPRALPRPPVTSVTLATPEVSVVALGVVEPCPRWSRSWRPSRWPPAGAVVPPTPAGQAAAPSVTPEFVE